MQARLEGETMGSWIRRQGPAFAVACLALMVALGGSVYAATRIDGRSVRPGSLPGNRLERASVPGNRLKPGTLGGGRIAPGSVTGKQVDAATLAKVPEAGHADSADTARSANTALGASFAKEAARINGHVAGCAQGLAFFAGACWEAQTSGPLSAVDAAVVCASRGGELPPVLALVAFGHEPDAQLAPGGEWSRDLAIFSGGNAYAVAAVNQSDEVLAISRNESRPFRCVIPLVN
jgi:hypothetical protein